MKTSQNQSEILIASDHAGFDLKVKLIKNMSHIKWIDLGPQDESRVDYPDFADRVASRISAHGGQGVLICGSGQGMAIRANRYPKVRAALAWSVESITLAREHNDANILCLGSRLLDHTLCEALVACFLSTPFAGERHADRVRKIDGPLGRPERE